MQPNHDIVVIGASAGGLDATRFLLRYLPPSLNASIFIILHGATKLLAEILGRASQLPVSTAQRGMVFERGKVYLAKLDAHLLLHDGHLLVRRGPRENMARPAIDPLFRSAAAGFGGRVIGIVLSGSLNDGTAGLRAIKRCGGITVVQHPLDALVPDMPTSALRYVDVDHVASIAGMVPLATLLVGEPAGPTPEIPLDIRLETAIAALEATGMEIEDRFGKLLPFSCPECQGVLWEIEDGDFLRYRCHTGHGFSGEMMLNGRSAEIDKLLAQLLCSYEERAALARRLADRQAASSPPIADHFRQRAHEYERIA